MRYKINIYDDAIEWYKNGLVHRLYGPATIFSDDFCVWIKI